MHEEENGISFVSPFSTLRLTTTIDQIWTCHVIVWRISKVVLTKCVNDSTIHLKYMSSIFFVQVRNLEYDWGGVGWKYYEIDCTIQAAKRLMDLKVHLGGITHANS